MVTEDTRSLEEIVDTLLAGRERIRILEAGCGSMTHFSYPKDAYVVGVDISEEQLEKNSLLQEKILGNLQEVVLPPCKFDLIICWDVLEHLPRPELAMKNFVKAVNAGGVIILASPNVLTVRGLLTKALPHFAHVWYYRYLVGFREAGTPGNYPFKSYHRFSMAPPAIMKFGSENNLSLELCRYTSWLQPEHKSAPFTTIWNPINRVVNLLSFNRIGTDERMGFQIVLSKNRVEGEKLG